MKNNKGITLIALIITIIVMLILVAVTINVALEGGLFTKAKDAAVKTDKHGIYETITSGAVFTDDGLIDINTTMTNALATLNAEEGITATDLGGGYIQVDSKTGTFYYQVTTTEIKIVDGAPDPSELIADYIGDYVNYDCMILEDDTSLYLLKGSNTVHTSATQTTSYYNQASENPNWKILGVDSSGRILITTEDAVNNGSSLPNKSFLGEVFEGYKGYNIYDRYDAFIDGLNNYCSIFGFGKYADTTAYSYTGNGGANLYGNNNFYSWETTSSGARSITMDDINKIQNYTPASPVKHTYSKGEDGYIYYDGVKGTDNITTFLGGCLNKTDLSNPGDSVELEHTNYTYELNNETPGQRLLKPSSINYYVATRLIDCNPSGIANCYCNIVETDYTFRQFKITTSRAEMQNSRGAGIRPVVVLKANVELKEQDSNGVWQLGYK